MALNQFRFRLLYKGKPSSEFRPAEFVRVLEDGRFILHGVFEVGEDTEVQTDAVEVWLLDRRLTKTGWPGGEHTQGEGNITIDYPLDLSMQSADTRHLTDQSIFGSLNQDSIRRAIQLKKILRDAQEKGYLALQNDNEFRRRVDEVLGTVDVWEEEEG